MVLVVMVLVVMVVVVTVAELGVEFTKMCTDAATIVNIFVQLQPTITKFTQRISSACHR